ncbi:telomerase reverse transcriptase-like [Ptychodera flava]|uniref:telomerase reverse transcriptase-like n=1 Tax=Ptychodera flava TaxID=63121 RepID=UPI00396A2D83
MEVIKAAYKHTAALLNYITALVGDQQIPPLMQDQDKQVYRHLLQTTVVGVNKEWTGKLTLQQVSNQSDVILRALQQIFHKEEQKGNILGIGFRKTYKSTEGLPVILTRRDIESNQPGVACSRFQSRPWQTLLNRVGDDIMMHLLLHTSLFMFVPPDCYVQITGIPIDNQQSAGKIKSASERRKKRRYGKAEEGIQGKKFKPSSAIQDVRRLRRKRCDSESGPSTKRQKVTLEAEIESGIDGNANIDEKAADDEDERSRQIIDGKKSKGMTSGVNQSVHVSGHQAASSNHKHTVDCEGSIQAMDANEKRKKEKRKRLKKEKTGIVDVPSKTEREEKFMKKQRTKRYKCRRKTKSKQNKMLFTINESEVLPREQLFYSKYSRESLPKSMPLNICSASNRGARKLLEMVFPEIKKKITKISNKKIQRTPKLLIRIKKIMVKLLKNHRRCRYDILLHHYCHIESLNKLSESGEDGGVKVYHRRAPNTDKVLPRKEQISGQSGAETFLSRYTDTVDVNRFVRAVGHRVVPTKLWGSNHNRQQFLKNVYQFLKLGRYEKFTLRQLVFGIKVSDCKWLAHSTTGHAGTQESLMKKTILYRVLRWLMIRVVMVVVKSMFYITESSVYRNHVFYYRKIIWNRCRSLGVQEYLNKGILKKVPSNEAKEKLKKMNKTSSNLRFLPKKSSLRPIVTMKGSSTMQARAKEVSLYGLLHVLSYIKNENPGQLGSSVLGFDDIYAKWKTMPSGVETRVIGNYIS